MTVTVFICAAPRFELTNGERASQPTVAQLTSSADFTGSSSWGKPF